MKQKTLLHTLLALLLASCTTAPKQVDSNIYSINSLVVLDEAVETNLSEIATNLQVVQLETLDECLVGNVPIVYLVDSLLIVNSIYTPVYVFNAENGKFKYDISGYNDKDAKGYSTTPRPMIINEEKNEIYLEKNRGLVVRDYITGEYKRQLAYSGSFKYQYHKIVNDTTFLVSLMNYTKTDNSTLNLVKQEDCSIIKEYGFFDSNDFEGSSRAYFFQCMYDYKNIIGYTYFKNDTIFGFDKTTLTLKPRFKLNLGKYLTPEDVNKDAEKPMYSSYLNAANVLESNRYLFIRYSMGSSYFLFFDKKRGESRYIGGKEGEIKSFKNDLLGYGQFFPSFITSDGKKAYTITQAIDFIEMVGEAKAAQMGIKEDDNPVIMIVDLKE
ncbi:MAG: 6-bladed beta-propeller [Rikenellaceae bacterium]